MTSISWSGRFRCSISSYQGTLLKRTTCHDNRNISFFNHSQIVRKKDNVCTNIENVSLFTAIASAFSKEPN